MANSDSQNKTSSFWDELLALIAGLFAAGLFSEHQQHFQEELSEEECELWEIFL